MYLDLCEKVNLFFGLSPAASRVELLASAILGIDLRKHEQFDIVR